MKFKKLNSNQYINVRIQKYAVDWDRVVSKPQKAVKDFFYPYWNADVVLEEFRIPGTLLRFDLVNLNKKLLVEVSPHSVHGKFNPFFHKTKHKFKESIKRDLLKYDWAEQNGFFLMEIYEEDIPNLSPRWFEVKYAVTI